MCTRRILSNSIPKSAHQIWQASLASAVIEDSFFTSDWAAVFCSSCWQDPHRDPDSRHDHVRTLVSVAIHLIANVLNFCDFCVWPAPTSSLCTHVEILLTMIRKSVFYSWLRFILTNYNLCIAALSLVKYQVLPMCNSMILEGESTTVLTKDHEIITIKRLSVHFWWENKWETELLPPEPPTHFNVIRTNDSIKLDDSRWKICICILIVTFSVLFSREKRPSPCL